ncbi:uncharacterized protein LOC112126692 isoform X1 [Cimex lectularius]|uniref:Uncharacterized protein n=1 Tax=Cimex lectularius TaxID=79782 RepID=A0A8I6TJ28_CIMLE|nr:uncharacterized protein LOC112126692 isoform X1 [Cimex lectularius]
MLGKPGYNRVSTGSLRAPFETLFFNTPAPFILYHGLLYNLDYGRHGLFKFALICHPTPCGGGCLQRRSVSQKELRGNQLVLCPPPRYCYSHLIHFMMVLVLFFYISEPVGTLKSHPLHMNVRVGDRVWVSLLLNKYKTGVFLKTLQSWDWRYVVRGRFRQSPAHDSLFTGQTNLHLIRWNWSVKAMAAGDGPCPPLIVDPRATSYIVIPHR